ncbi:hypothetical protein FXO37_09466 [Capsicum annuum]|nr:hypothetical protein FXO37_09466 [Capsicum annuum]
MYILEILEQFAELQLDFEQKHKYVVWKAANIRKAIKERRKPVSVPPSSDDDFSLLGLPGLKSIRNVNFIVRLARKRIYLLTLGTSASLIPSLLKASRNKKALVVELIDILRSSALSDPSTIGSPLTYFGWFL